MKKHHYTILLIGILLPFLVQCASQQDMQSTNVKVYTIDKQVENIDKEVAELRNQTVKEVQTRQAIVDSRIDSLEAELLRLNGQLEESAHHNRLLREENKEIESSFIARIEVLEEEQNKKLAQLEETISQVNDNLAKTDSQLSQAEAEIEKINQERAQEAAARARKAAEEARKAAQEAKAAKATIVRTDGTVQISADKKKKTITGTPDQSDDTSPDAVRNDDLYAQALSLYKAKKIDQAYDGFTDYLNRYPDGKMAANARFWMGECLFTQNEFELAILDYQKVIVDYPRHTKAPAALLKQGMAFEKLNDDETAKIVYQKILDTYPESDQAGPATSRLQSLK
jgi:tol-pal system protein YbgF